MSDPCEYARVLEYAGVCGYVRVLEYAGVCGYARVREYVYEWGSQRGRRHFWGRENRGWRRSSRSTALGHVRADTPAAPASRVASISEAEGYIYPKTGSFSERSGFRESRGAPAGSTGGAGTDKESTVILCAGRVNSDCEMSLYYRNRHCFENSAIGRTEWVKLQTSLYYAGFAYI